MTTALALVLLIAVLVVATIRPRGLPEAAVAVPAAAITILAGLVSPHTAGRTLAVLGPTVGFLAAVLMLAHAADRAGVFHWAGTLATHHAHGSSRRLLAVVFVIASVTTAVLSLDATIVLLTPAVLVAASRMRVRARPHAFACAHLANSASLLLPVSNLTNLLAFHATGLTFLGFTARMALPWLVAITVEYVIFRWFFRSDLRATPAGPQTDEEDVPVPAFALAVLALTLIGFAVVEQFGVRPAWVALAGAIVLGGVNLVRNRRTDGIARPLRRQILAANPVFCAFVFALGIVVAGVRATGTGHVIAAIVPSSTGLGGLLAAAALAAAAANVLNNLPATLLLVPLVAQSPALVLAVLLGVNIGPNLTYVGSLATLLWREVLHKRGHFPGTGTYLRLGALTVPPVLAASVLALWSTMRW